MTSLDFNLGESLVRYGTPTLVVDRENKEPPRLKKQLALISTPEFADDVTPAVERNINTQDILDCILPPKEWVEGGKLWRQQISAEPATRSDVLKLGETLDRRLQEKQARETGICPIRRELFTQAFDEIIRQVTINCAERGLLLLRVRDEMRKTAASYQSLYESCIAYGMRKALMAEQDKLEFADEMEKLKQEKFDLKNKLSELKHQLEVLEVKNAEFKTSEMKKFQDELSILKRTNAQIKSQLESIIAPKRV